MSNSKLSRGARQTLSYIKAVSQQIIHFVDDLDGPIKHIMTSSIFPKSSYDNNVGILECALQSPDINPVENLRNNWERMCIQGGLQT